MDGDNQQQPKQDVSESLFSPNAFGGGEEQALVDKAFEAQRVGQARLGHLLSTLDLESATVDDANAICDAMRDSFCYGGRHYSAQQHKRGEEGGEEVLSKRLDERYDRLIKWGRELGLKGLEHA